MKPRRFGPIALRAAAAGAVSTGAFAAGALAIGALAIGAFVVGRLSVGRAYFKEVRIDSLTVGVLEFDRARADDAPTPVDL